MTATTEQSSDTRIHILRQLLLIQYVLLENIFEFNIIIISIIVPIRSVNASSEVYDDVLGQSA